MKYYSFWLILFLLFVFSSCQLSRNINSDFALYKNSNDWSHDYAMGSPSWDTFERLPGNPVYRGHKGEEWPVNGFLFLDPVSRDWYLYIGVYREFYKSYKDSTHTRGSKCIVYKSSDKGKSWKLIGDLFPNDMPFFSDSLKYAGAPDVMVTYADGKYHMVFDWGANDFDWEHAYRGGLGYAVADKPEGPWIVSAKPIKVDTQFLHKPLLGRYWRMYAPMIVKQKNDWVLLYMMDTQPPRSWALAASTSKEPWGPYTHTTILRHAEVKKHYPPLIEYFPAFTYKKYVYIPGTSVSINRNYQYVQRVKIKDVTNPDKYRIFNAGSFWHPENVENEYAGIWGQTFSAFIDNRNDSMYVMFPSKDKNDFGTINLAKASWKHLYRNQGFNFDANEGNSFLFIKEGIDVGEINMNFSLDGTMHLIWDSHTPIDIQNGWGKFSLDQNNANYKEIVINRRKWKINVYVDNNIQTIDSGTIQNWQNTGNNLILKIVNSQYSLTINSTVLWEGKLNGNPGIMGVFLDPHSYLYANSFLVSGKKIKGHVTYGFYRALVNAGDQDSDWTFKKDTMFLNGNGAVSKKDSSFAKWNFFGKRFSLFSPKGPLYGTVNIYLDGKLLRRISLEETQPKRSSMIFQSDTFRPGDHAVYIESSDGLLPVDCIKVEL
ncbi:MAG: hypothetical protein EPN37_00115 [Chitinophagaceae bacterium]|nr:MAG: hypothetical protein EPN37_00115 [Chitinophagaceae bacterium]